MNVNHPISFPKPVGQERHGFVQLDLIIGLAILSLAILPLAFSLARETSYVHAEYQHAVAMEIVDGEMEILAAGDWTNFPDGTHPYSVRAKAAAQLPGQFQLTRSANHLRLEWRPDKRIGIGAVIREINLK